MNDHPDPGWAVTAAMLALLIVTVVLAIVWISRGHPVI